VATVLHIEDDPANRLLVRKLLGAAGHEVIDAESGLEGIRIATARKPDLVLVDIDVPDLDAALAWAEKCPAAQWGVVEIRPSAVRFAGGRWIPAQ